MWFPLTYLAIGALVGVKVGIFAVRAMTELADDPISATDKVMFVMVAFFTFVACLTLWPLILIGYGIARLAIP